MNKNVARQHILAGKIREAGAHLEIARYVDRACLRGTAVAGLSLRANAALDSVQTGKAGRSLFTHQRVVSGCWNSKGVPPGPRLGQSSADIDTPVLRFERIGVA